MAERRRARGGWMMTIDQLGWKEASLGATPRVISGVNVSDGYLWGSGGSSYSHSSSGVSRQKHRRQWAIRVSDWFGEEARSSVKNRLEIFEYTYPSSSSSSSSYPPSFLFFFFFFFFAIDALDTLSRYLETIKIIYSTLFQGYRHLDDGEVEVEDYAFRLLCT